MRAVIQRVSSAEITINGKEKRHINKGLVVLIGIEDADDQADIDWLTAKIVNLRIFNDDAGIMNLSAKEINGDVLAVSQFTLHASTKQGNRPSYMKASKPDIAIPLYNEFIKGLQQQLGKGIQTGEFGADMQVALINDGPVTILIDSKAKE